MTGNKYIIMNALRLTELQYGEMVMAYAQRWMERYFGTEPLVISALHNSKSFWQWWVNQWDNRDVEFLRLADLKNENLPLDETTLHYTKEAYQDHHNSDQLRIRPNKFVVREVGALIKIEEKKLKALLA